MLSKYFSFEEKGTNLKTEVIAGFTTFLTMAYIIFVNPEILSSTGMDKQALVAVTCIVSALATIAVGMIARAPIAMAPGMGLNAFFAYSLVMNEQISWETGLGVVFVSGLLFLILTAAGLRKRIVTAIPQSMIAGISVGIGLFITFIGLQNLGLVIDSEATLVQAARINPTILIGVAGLVVMIFLELRNVKGSLLIGIAFSTVLAVLLGKVDPPDKLVGLSLNISDVAFKMDLKSVFQYSLIGPIFTLMFIDMFDSVGTLIAVAYPAKLVNEKGRIQGLDRLLAIDAGATMFGALMGTSTTTSYIESAAGIEQGGRTGFTAIVTGLLFLLATLFVPLIRIVPAYATAPALIMVGLFMMKEIRKIDFSDVSKALPAFFIVVLIALSYSISTGLALGFIAFTMIKIISGRLRQVKPAMWIITGLSIVYFLVPVLEKGWGG